MFKALINHHFVLHSVPEYDVPIYGVSVYCVPVYCVLTNGCARWCEEAERALIVGLRAGGTSRADSRLQDDSAAYSHTHCPTDLRAKDSLM